MLNYNNETHAYATKIQNYFSRDYSWQNETDIPVKDDIVADNWAKN